MTSADFRDLAKLLPVRLNLELESDHARNHVRHIYREAKRIGVGRFDARLLAWETVSACKSEGDWAFLLGARAEARAMRLAS